MRDELEEVTERLKELLRIFRRICENGRYTPAEVSALEAIIVEVPQDIVEMWKELLAANPYFPSGLSFEDVWAAPKGKFAAFIRQREARLEQSGRAHSERHQGVTSIDTAFRMLNDRKWSDDEFANWYSGYWLFDVDARDRIDNAYHRSVERHFMEEVRPALSSLLATLNGEPSKSGSMAATLDRLIDSMSIDRSNIRAKRGQLLVKMKESHPDLKASYFRSLLTRRGLTEERKDR